MNSRDLMPIRDKLATGSQHQTLCECSLTIRNKVQSFFVHNTVKTLFLLIMCKNFYDYTYAG